MNWEVKFGVYVYNPNFVLGTFPEQIRRVLKNDQHPQETAHCVAVQARTKLIRSTEHRIFSDNDLRRAEEKMKEFLQGNIVVTTPQYKLTYMKLEENRDAAKRHNQQVQQQIDKLRIILETAIKVALSNVSYPCQEQHASADDDEDDDEDDDYLDYEAQRERLAVELYGPYLPLVTDLPNKYDIPRR